MHDAETADGMMGHEMGNENPPSKSPIKVQWTIDLGHIITFLVMIVGFGVQYGSLSARLAAVEVQAAKASQTNESLNITLGSLKDTIIRVQTQMDEREKRFDRSQAEQNSKMDARDLREFTPRTAR